MKFGDKYELLESLTTGGVETFIANDKVRGERVLVHILHCEPQKPNQPTVHWVLESFRRVAPEPVGLVLETGRYSGTLYAYVVSRLPEKVTLDAWVKQYEDQARDTQEFRIPTTPSLESEAPTAEVTEKEPKALERPPGPVTQLFREFDLQPKSGANPSPSREPVSTEPVSSEPVSSEPEHPSAPLSGASSWGDKSGIRPAAPRNSEPATVSVPPRIPFSIGNPSEAFHPENIAKSLPAVSAQPAKHGPKPGEFTSFFQGPFRGDRPSETPALTPRQEPPRKNVGDFTAMFGPVKPQAEEPPPSAGMAGNEPSGTGFTGWFSPDVPSRTSSATSPPPSTGLPRATVDPVLPPPTKEPMVPPFAPPFVAPAPAVSVPPAPPIFPTPLSINPPMPKPPTVSPTSLPSAGATSAFSRPNFEGTPVPLPSAPSGPSAYTQVISVKPMPPAGDAAPAQKAATASPSLPAFAAPAMPAPPPPTPPPASAAGATPAPQVSYWPLFLTLTVLFFIAVLLVLYFVLKR